MKRRKHERRKKGLGRSLLSIPHILAGRLLDWSIEAPRGYESNCWIWQGRTDKDGYPEIKFRGYKYRAARVSYAAFVNPIPDGMDVDHLCRVPSCVNPRHLDCVDPHTNRVVRRGERLLRLKKPAETFDHVSEPPF